VSEFQVIHSQNTGLQIVYFLARLDLTTVTFLFFLIPLATRAPFTTLAARTLAAEVKSTLVAPTTAAALATALEGKMLRVSPE
jgi:hypothetical protein